MFIGMLATLQTKDTLPEENPRQSNNYQYIKRRSPTWSVQKQHLFVRFTMHRAPCAMTFTTFTTFASPLEHLDLL